MPGADIHDRLVLSCRGTRVCVSADISASKFPIYWKHKEKNSAGEPYSGRDFASKVMVLVIKLPIDLLPCVHTKA